MENGETLNVGLVVGAFGVVPQFNMKSGGACIYDHVGGARRRTIIRTLIWQS